MWIDVLNKSFDHTLEIKKNQPLGFFADEPENLKFHYVPEKRKAKIKYRRTNRRWKRQSGGFLNRYDFAYAGGDVVNQAANVAPGIIKAPANDINNIAEQRINQIISQEGKEVERVLPKIIWGAIEEVHQTPSRLLGNFGKQQLNKIKRKILR